jgi:hypothetical protein
VLWPGVGEGGGGQEPVLWVHGGGGGGVGVSNALFGVDRCSCVGQYMACYADRGLQLAWHGHVWA